MPFLEPSISTDPAEIAAIGIDYLRSKVPGWEPSDGDPMTWLIEAHARMIAEERDQAATVYAQIFQFMGEKIDRIPMQAATAATVSATITVRDRAGYTIPAGLEVHVATAGDDGVLFVVQGPVTIAPGVSTTSAGEVTLRAAVGHEGVVGNGLTSANDATILQAEQQWQSVALVGESSGGVDAESLDDYLERVAEARTLSSPIPILADDFAALARQHPSVGRALALNLYDPDTRTSDNERMCTVVVADADGEPLSRTIRAEVQADLESKRELNWRSPVIDPTYTAIDVEFEATTWPGEDAAVVRDAALAALAAGLSPAAWGARPGVGEQPGWIDDPTVRYLEVSQLLNEVAGLRWVDRLEIGLEGRTLGTSDITLTGPGALPRPGTGITGTVTEG